MTEVLKTRYVKQLLEHVWAFKPNPRSFGGVSYLLRRTRGNLLVDAPIFDTATCEVFDELGLPTHVFVTHRDDVAEVHRFREKYGVPIIIHESERDEIPGGADITFNDKYKLDEEILLIHTPGHSPGGVSYAIDDLVFTGDALFLGSIGRTDGPGGSFETLVASITTRLFSLSNETVVYPGHGPKSTIGVEKRSNPFVGEERVK